MKAILFPYWFEAPDELNEFCKSIGYNNPDYSNDYNLMFDSRVVEFCQQRLSNLWNEKVYKGRDSYKFRIGFAGAGYCEWCRSNRLYQQLKMEEASRQALEESEEDEW